MGLMDEHPPSWHLEWDPKLWLRQLPTLGSWLGCLDGVSPWLVLLLLPRVREAGRQPPRNHAHGRRGVQVFCHHKALKVPGA